MQDKPKHSKFMKCSKLRPELPWSDELQFIFIPIGSYTQQVTVTPKSIWSHMRSFWNRTSNYLAQKIISQPPPPFQGILQLRVSVALAR